MYPRSHHLSRNADFPRHARYGFCADRTRPGIRAMRIKLTTREGIVSGTPHGTGRAAILLLMRNCEALERDFFPSALGSKPLPLGFKPLTAGLSATPVALFVIPLPCEFDGLDNFPIPRCFELIAVSFKPPSLEFSSTSLTFFLLSGCHKSKPLSELRIPIPISGRVSEAIGCS